MIYVLIILFALFAHRVATTGEKREIGYEWSLFFSVFFSPLVGFVIIQHSEPKSPDTKDVKPTTKDKIWASVFLLSALVLAYVTKISFQKYLNKEFIDIRDQFLKESILFACLSIGFLGAAVYRFKL